MKKKYYNNQFFIFFGKPKVSSARNRRDIFLWGKRPKYLPLVSHYVGNQFFGLLCSYHWFWFCLNGIEERFVQTQLNLPDLVFILFFIFYNGDTNNILQMSEMKFESCFLKLQSNYYH
jgi:hypothetical protein